MPGKIFHMKNRDELANFVKVNDYVIIKIGAEWCGPCKRIQPTVDKLFQQMPNDVHLVMVDADDGDIAAALRVKVLPTFLNYIKGDLQDVYATGDEESVVKFFQSTLNRATKD
jgi:thioredoxin 1